MSSSPDLYMQWLSIPPGPRPPDHYALLGVPRGCGDVERIEAAVRRQMDRLDALALHPDAQKRQSVQEMMNRLAQARGCLIDARRRKAYDLAQGIVSVSAAPDNGQKPTTPRAGSPATPEPETPAEGKAQDALKEFETRVRGHMQKWKLNTHEETLLLAEAALMGMDEPNARATIKRIGGSDSRPPAPPAAPAATKPALPPKAPIQAQPPVAPPPIRKRRRWRLKKWLLGIIAVETLVVLAMPTARDIVDKLNDYDRILRENPQLKNTAPVVAPAPPQPQPAPALPPAPQRRRRR